MKIGIFDSGRGGELIAEGVQKLLPMHEYFVVNDREHVPYGSRSDAEIITLTDAAIRPLLDSGCPIIVVACNTATMAGIETLRSQHPDKKFVGTEPMIKPAALESTTKKIIVLGTPLTMKSARYADLKAMFAREVQVTEPDTTSWAARIESGDAESISFDELEALVRDGYDTIVLACTHYLALKKRLQTELPNTLVLEPTEAIARQVERLAQNLLQP
jgi:glutamate racemase